MRNITEKDVSKWGQQGNADDLIFAAEHGMFNIRLKCIELLAPKKKEEKVKQLLISMIKDDVEIVANAAINELRPSASSELIEKINKVLQEREAQKKKVAKMSYLSNLSFEDNRSSPPRDRLMDRLHQQQNSNNLPY
ncbi:hypothetical protein [Fulvivirga ligni]|uniref:hypothetical protein n=1 Tax=Fulvivirga ligni TaxID=2904246 RepID=UPI001F23A19C|nr:hypothetical protein [Fulvivirga ligni]UII20739.1 hypothetical protein LVD16_23130 [Fulvivirga ligni]